MKMAWDENRSETSEPVMELLSDENDPTDPGRKWKSERSKVQRSDNAATNVSWEITFSCASMNGECEA
ncbi:MAG: hypothetical protein HQM09_23375 [Candidatus Riflebacteria bacterium]|nr:hypothetical protein [Candidatus Riflebacteria bacterium]